MVHISLHQVADQALLLAGTYTRTGNQHQNHPVINVRMNKMSIPLYQCQIKRQSDNSENHHAPMENCTFHDSCMNRNDVYIYSYYHQIYGNEDELSGDHNKETIND